MPEYEYKLVNGKTLSLTGDEPPSDEEVESIATEQGVSLVPIESIKKTPFINKITARPEDFTEQRSFPSRFWEAINEPYEWAKPIVESAVSKTGMPEGHPLKETYRGMVGGAFSPLGIGSELLSGVGLIGKSAKYLKPVEKAAEVAGEMIPPTMPSIVNQRPIRALLPETTPKPSFISGEAGTAINKPYLYDLGPTNPPLGNKEIGTVLPREVEGLAEVSPELLASGIVGPKPSVDFARGRTDRLLTGEIGETEQWTQPKFYTELGHARPGQSQLPSAPIKMRIKQNIVKELETQQVPEETAQSVAEVAVNIPEIAKVIQNSSFIQKFLRRETPTSRFIAKGTSSIDYELANQHPQLGELVKQTQVDSHIMAGTWINRYDKIIDKLNESEFKNFVRAIEGKEKPANDTVGNAIELYKRLDNEISTEATNTGMGLRSKDGTKMVPWQPRENYWPHLYTEEFFNTLKNNPLELRARLTEAGMSPLEIDALLNNSKRFGERLIDAQHAREAHLPGYRIDKNVYRQHISEMAKRITEAKNYGPMDLADNESPLMNLITASKNPEYSTEIMKKLLNRGERSDFDSIDISRKVTAAQAWLHLSTAGISNLNTTAMIPIRNNTRSFIKGLTDTIFSSRETGEFAKESGALQNIFREIFAAEINESAFSPTKVYGLDEGERFMRTLSSSAGRSYAKQLFNEVKGGNASEFNLKKLQDLTLTNPTDLMKQTELNTQQLKRAAFRSAELSQGLAEPQHLPQYWTGSGLANILTLFHKYQFAQTKIVKDLIKSNPVRTIPMLLGASQVAGEITGDAKAIIRGLIRGAVSGDETKIEEEIMNRGQFIESKFGLEDNPAMARFIENMGQSFALGIYADVIESMAGGGSDVLKQLAGSALNDLMKVIDIGKDITKGEFYKATTKGTSLVPLIGPPIAAEMRESANAR